MQEEQQVEALVAEVLGLSVSAIHDGVGFRTVPEWDSLRHVELMLALEERWGAEIGPDRVAELTSVAAIRRFAAGLSAAVVRMPSTATGSEERPPHRGLSGVEVDHTEISRIDGEQGVLSYRGYPIEDLAQHATFEEVAHLLVEGDLPTSEQLRSFRSDLRSAMTLPRQIVPLVEAMRDAHPMDALRTGISALEAFDPEGQDPSPTGMARAGRRLIGQTTALVLEHHRARTGRNTAAGRTPAEALLAGVTGAAAVPEDVRSLERVMVLLAEHGANASAFAARVAIGTRARLHGAITAAVGTFAGPLHGGAIEGVADMIEEIGTPERAAAHVRTLRNRKEAVLGFGHRLYRTEDPRAVLLRAMARELTARGDTSLRIVEAVRRAMRRHTRYGVDVNVDLYAGLVLRQLGIPTDLLSAVFVVARMPGWVAHCLEQRRNNVLIRPLLRYAGPPERSFVPVEARGTPRRSALPSGG